MNILLRFALLLVLGTVTLVPTTQAQFVNFEETWQKFLQEDKTVNVSRIVKPAKDQTVNYLRWCLMFANNDFCSARIEECEALLTEIEFFGPRIYGDIPGFAPKYDDLKAKVDAYHRVDELWTQFLRNRQVNLRDLDLPVATRVCELGTLAKHRYMLAYMNLCAGDEAAALDNFENRVLILADKTSLRISDVEGLEREVDRMRGYFSGLSLLQRTWEDFLLTGESIGVVDPLPEVPCYVIPKMKEAILEAAVNPCTKGREQLAMIRDLEKRNNASVPDDLREKIRWLEGEVERYNADLAILGGQGLEAIPGYRYGDYCHDL